MLYGKSGSLKGDQLPLLLNQAVLQSGKSFGYQQFAYLSGAVDNAKAAIAAEDKGAAALAIASLSKLGKPGELSEGSYSSVAKEADEIVNKLLEEGKASIEEAVANLNSADSAFNGALTLVEANRIYKKLPTLKNAATLALRTAHRDSTKSILIKQAEGIDNARRQSKLTTATSKKLAIASYELVIKRYPGTPADKLARSELAEIDPNSELLSSPAPSGYRTWTDSTGKFRVEAKLVSFANGQATLLRRDGKAITLPLDRLSAGDQTFLQTQ